MSNPTEAVSSYIEKNREEVVDFLRKLVSFPSVTGNERDIQDFISSWLNDSLRVKVDVWEPNIEEASRFCPGG